MFHLANISTQSATDPGLTCTLKCTKNDIGEKVKNRRIVYNILWHLFTNTFVLNVLYTKLCTQNFVFNILYTIFCTQCFVCNILYTIFYTQNFVLNISQPTSTSHRPDYQTTSILLCMRQRPCIYASTSLYNRSVSVLVD